MRIFKKAAISTTAVGLLAFGAVIGGGGAALAGTASVQYQVVTGCTNTLATVSAGVQPNCVAIGGTTDNPTAIYIYVDTSSLTIPTGSRKPSISKGVSAQAMDASWTLVCKVNGAVVSVPGTFDVSSPTAPAVDTINLQDAVGSPDPIQCTVQDLTVQTAVPLTGSETAPYTVGVAALANNATPGAIHQDEGTTSAGAHAALCADDKNNADAGSKIQSFQCLSDLADAFVQTSTGQLVHNGDCVSLTAGGYVFLARCAAHDTAQRWVQTTAGGWVKNMSTGTCLTAPSVKSGVQLTVKSCGSGANQKWDIPAATAAPVQPARSAEPVWSTVR